MKETESRKTGIYRFSLQSPERIFDGRFVRYGEYQRQSDLLTESLDALSKLVRTIERWEEDVRKVIQIPVEHGMDLREAKSILAKHKEGERG